MRDREQRNCSRRHLPPLKSARGPNSALQICIASKTRIQSEKWISLSFVGLSGSISNHKNENRRSRLRASGGTRAQSGPLSRACRHGRFANRRAVPGKSLGRWGGGGEGMGVVESSSRSSRESPPPPLPALSHPEFLRCLRRRSGQSRAIRYPSARRRRGRRRRRWGGGRGDAATGMAGNRGPARREEGGGGGGGGGGKVGDGGGGESEGGGARRGLLER